MSNPPPGQPGPTPPPRRQPGNVPPPGPAAPLPRALPRAAAPPPPPPPVPTVACPYCNQMMQAPPQLAGQVVNCPHCRGQIELPGIPQPGPYGNVPPAAGPYAAGPYGSAPYGGAPYGAPQGGFPNMAADNSSPLQFNTAPKRSSSTSYKRKKSTSIIPMLMMIATGIWLLAMPLTYLYFSSQGEAEIRAQSRGGVVMTRNGTISVARAHEAVGAAAAFGGFCCPTTFYGITMIALLIAMAVSKADK